MRFLRTFICLYEAGVNVPASVTMAAEASSNSVIAGDLMTAVPILERGGSFAEAFGGCSTLPHIVVSMLMTGEQSGKLDETLAHAADYLQAEADTTTDRVVQILPVLAYLLIAGYIASIVISFYSGYFQAINDAGNL